MQRPLWASTSTKNPAYPDTAYVDQLIGPDTVNTMPEETIEAFLDHGTVARTVDADLEAAQATLDALAEVGVDLDDVAEVLEEQGVAAFAKAFDELIGALDAKAAELGADLMHGELVVVDDVPGRVRRARHRGVPRAARTTASRSPCPAARRPAACYERLADDAGTQIDWWKVDVYWGDERCVPHDSPESNYHLARTALLEQVGAVNANYPMFCDEGADPYQLRLGELGRLDVVHLGLGADGHTASLFPGSPGLDADPGRLVVMNEDPSGRNPHPRMTLTFAGIARARLVLVTVSGEEKREALAQVRGRRPRLPRLPRQRRQGRLDRRPGRGRLTEPTIGCRHARADGRSADAHRDLAALPLATLMARARAVRDDAHGRRVTFSPKVFIPLTMLCRDRCGYCTFAQPPARLESPYLTPEQVLAIARAGAAAGCHEALFTLGEGPEDRYPVARDVARRARLRAPRSTTSPPWPGSCSTRPACSPTPTPARSTRPTSPSSAPSRPARG